MRLLLRYEFAYSASASYRNIFSNESYGDSTRCPADLSENAWHKNVHSILLCTSLPEFPEKVALTPRKLRV